MNVFSTPAILPRLYPSLLWRVKTARKVIYLTFDDGPVPGPTEFVLDTLRSYQAKATFFCIGDNARKHPFIFKRILDEDHVIGNHTFNHLKGWNTPHEQYIDNVARCQRQFDESDNRWSQNSTARKLFRPPYGRIKRSQIRSLLDYRIVMWDVLTNDYDKALKPERCLQKSIAATRPGSIVVFHDSLKAEQTMSFVLPRYMEHFAKEGYAFESIPVAT